jgi:prophage regulatory protein
MDIFLRRTEVERITGLSRSEIYRRIADDEFPQPIQLGKRAVAWSQIAIEQWQESCRAAGWDPNRLSINDDKEALCA